MLSWCDKVAVGIGWIAIISFLVGPGISRAQSSGNDSVARTQAEQGKDDRHTIVEMCRVRLSRRLLENVDVDVETSSEVHDVVLGTPVSGTAVTRGKVSLDFEPRENDIGLVLRFTGQSTSNTVGRNRSAIIYSQSQTQFHSTKQIVFDPDKGVLTRNAQIDSDTSVCNRGIESTKPGLRGAIVRRVAARRVMQSRGAVQAHAASQAQVRIRASFDAHADQRLHKINEALWVIAPAVHEYRRVSDSRWHFATTDDALYATLCTKPGVKSPPGVAAEPQREPAAPQILSPWANSVSSDQRLVEVWLPAQWVLPKFNPSTSEAALGAEEAVAFGALMVQAAVNLRRSQQQQQQQQEQPQQQPEKPPVRVDIRQQDQWLCFALIDDGAESRNGD